MRRMPCLITCCGRGKEVEHELGNHGGIIGNGDMAKSGQPSQLGVRNESQETRGLHAYQGVAGALENEDGAAVCDVSDNEVSPGGRGAEGRHEATARPMDPVISGKVDDVEAARSQAQQRGYEIGHLSTTEEWGVTPFFVASPTATSFSTSYRITTEPGRLGDRAWLRPRKPLRGFVLVALRTSRSRMGPPRSRRKGILL